MKKLLMLIVLIICISVLQGCPKVPKEITSNKNGVYTAFGIESYIFKLPSGKTVRDYFSLMGSSKEIIVELLYDTKDGNNMSTVEYCRESRGGHVAYTKNLVMYIPEDDDLKKVQTIACALVENPEYMSAEEVKKYIPWL